MQAGDRTNSFHTPDKPRPNTRKTAFAYFRSLSGEEAARVDYICDVFETKLVTGQQPVIEEYLGGFNEAARRALVCELLLLELEGVKSSGRLPDREGYLHRFPNEAEVVERVLDQWFPQPSASASSNEVIDSVPTLPGYQLQHKLGSGGMGTVYKAIQLSLERAVAIKVLRDDRVADVEARLRFMQEIKVVGQLKHPNIVEAYDAGHPAGVYYLSMEYIHGLDLAAVLRRCGPLPVADVCEVARCAAIGLQQAHRLNLVHRDIKPSNLLLGRASAHDDNVQLKIADLGLARLGAAASLRAPDSQYRNVLGTFDYMAPEQYFNSDEVDIRADIYSLGCTMFALLLGRAPFSGPNYNKAVKKMEGHRKAPPPSIREARPDVPTELEASIHKMMAKKPEQRFQTPEDMAEGLAPFCEGHDLTELLLSAEEREEPAVSKTPVVISPTVSVEKPVDNERELDAEASPNQQSKSDSPFAENSSGSSRAVSEDGLAGSKSSRNKLIAAVSVLLAAIVLSVVCIAVIRSNGSVTEPPGEDTTTDLLELVDPLKDSVGGDWYWEEGVLVSPEFSKTWLLLPSKLPAQYKLEITASKPRNADFVIGIVWNEERIPIVHRAVRAVAVDASQKTNNNNEDIAKKLGFQAGPSHTYTCIVRSEGFAVGYEDKVVAVRRKGGVYAVPAENVSWLAPRGDGLFIGAHNGAVRVSQVRLTQIPSRTED